jgi:hypothetical protein
VLKLIGTLARVAFGFALASIAAGLVTVLFVNTPADVLAQPVSRLPETAGETFDLALLTATHVAIFASAFVLIVAGVGETFSIRSLAFYLLAGMVIAALGFIAQYASEVSGQPTILNNYAMKAFLTAGFFAGFVYWLAAGQFAGKPPPEAGPRDEAPEEPATVTVTEAKARSGVAPDDGEPDAGVVITRPAADEPRKSRYATLLHRLRRPGQPSLAETEPDPLADEKHYRADDEDETSVIVRRPATTSEERKAGGSDKPDDDA